MSVKLPIEEGLYSIPKINVINKLFPEMNQLLVSSIPTYDPPSV
jgi:hypothetical protein